MRRLLAGIFLTIFLVPLLCRAETTGFVESIGFGWMYRPNCHIPMLVNITPDKSGTFQIKVYQKDMDQDLEIFSQTVSLTGGTEGSAASQQKFWIYFIPQPTEGGLSGLTLRELQGQLKVFLCDEKGKQIAQLPVTQTILNVDAAQGGPFSIARGNKLILAVSDTPAQPVWRDYQQSIGLLEDVIFCPVRSFDLPEDVRGYEMVDGIIWLSANVPDPAKASDEKRHHALREYVRGGGHLVVCQPPQRDATANFDDILPVKVTAIAPKKTLSPLKDIGRVVWEKKHQRDQNLNIQPSDLTADEEATRGPNINDWERPTGPFMFARAELKPDAIAEVMIDWNEDGKDRTPWLARHGVGAGAVTWVAEDLSDPVITSRAKSGWPLVWDRVLDYKNDITIVDARTDQREKDPYIPNATSDVGHALLQGMELTSKSRALVSIAVVFFIAYWVIAGPGVYFYLLTKARAQLSWFLFAVAALGATLFTVLVVKLVVRGPPEVSHLTLVRAAANEPAISISRFGLYIPRDGPQEIKLPDVAPKEVSYLTGYPEHPSHTQGDVEFPAAEHYDIPIRDASSDEPCAIVVPYRSTLKKFQARRVGPVAGLVQGSAKIHDKETAMTLDGVLTNGTGQKLRNVYFVYNDPRIDDDVIYFLPTWEKGTTIDLADFNLKSVKIVGFPQTEGPNTARPEDGVKLMHRMGKIDNGWSRYWFAAYRSSGIGAPTRDDLGDPVPISFPLMSLFSRLPPMRNSGGGLNKQDRADILRRGGRYLDVSSAVAAGRLVVLAEADGEQELPFPLEVEGSKVPGKGRIFYQFVLPLDHPAGTETAATQPVADPTPAPAPLPEPAFDPANFRGNFQDLTPEQRDAVIRYRRGQYQNRRRTTSTTRPQPAPRSSMRPLVSPYDDGLASMSSSTLEAATWPQ